MFDQVFNWIKLNFIVLNDFLHDQDIFFLRDDSNPVIYPYLQLQYKLFILQSVNVCEH